MGSLAIHPELRLRLRGVLTEDVGEKRAEDALLALDATWAILGYTQKRRPWTEQDLHAIASLAAGVLEAERIVGGGDPTPGKHCRSDVRLRLVEGGKV